MSVTFALPIVPLLGALAVLGARRWITGHSSTAQRRSLAAASLIVMATLGAATALALFDAPSATFAWGAGLALSVRIVPEVAVAVVLLPLVATPVLLWSCGHEGLEGAPRLIAGLLAFVGAMELLVLADDLLTLIVGWELVGGLSYALIAHRWRDRSAVGSAAYAFNATRAGGLGLFVAAGAAIAATGSLSFASLAEATATPWGHWIAAGVLLAAASKSAQLPFSPWLFRAMDGPSGVSALLHSSTMVAAGAWILVRLSEPLSAVGWLGPATIGIGLSTALVGGVVAVTQPHAKKLLAASTSVHYGLMFVAAGAGAAGGALSHLVTHALFKSLLFLVAGAAITAAGSGQLARMRLGRPMPFAAAASLVGSLSLAGAPPLGGGWSKERVVAAAGHGSTWLLIATIAAAGLGGLYAARFHLLAFGRRGAAAESPPANGRSGWLERGAYAWLAMLVLGSSAAWWPGVAGAVERWLSIPVPEGPLWELALSVGVVVSMLALAWALDRRGSLARLGHPRTADWLGLPRLIEAVAARPALATARACARFDDRVVDAGVRAAAAIGRGIAIATSFVFEGTVDRLAELAGRWTRAADRRPGRHRGVFDFVVHGLARGGERGAAGARDAHDGVLDAIVNGLARISQRAALQSRTADDDAIDGTVARAAHAVGALGRDARRTQRGAIPTYYAIAMFGLAAGVAILVFFGW